MYNNFDSYTSNTSIFFNINKIANLLDSISQENLLFH